MVSIPRRFPVLVSAVLLFLAGPSAFAQDYRDAKKTELEYKLLFRALIQTQFGRDNGLKHWEVQGLYIVSPSGQLLSGRSAAPHAKEII